jgi:hypothetical protein
VGKRIAGSVNAVSVSAKDVQVERTVRMADFTKWLARKGGSAADIVMRKWLREFWGCRAMVRRVRINLTGIPAGGVAMKKLLAYLVYGSRSQ